MKRALILLAMVAAGQLAIPVCMVRRQEQTLREGRAYRFRTAPVDPYDAFRGRYVQLSFEQNSAPWAGGTVVYRQPGFAEVAEGGDGYAVVRRVALTPPAQGDYCKVELSYPGWGTNAGVVNFRLPFDRYYMEETKAPTAERVYRQQNRRDRVNSNTYALVFIKDGHAALGELYIGDKPVHEVLKTP